MKFIKKLILVVVLTLGPSGDAPPVQIGDVNIHISLFSITVNK